MPAPHESSGGSAGKDCLIGVRRASRRRGHRSRCARLPGAARREDVDSPLQRPVMSRASRVNSTPHQKAESPWLSGPQRPDLLDDIEKK